MVLTEPVLVTALVLAAAAAAWWWVRSLLAAGAATAALLQPLCAEGWTVLHDRAFPGGRTNIHHLAISPAGAVFLPDSHRWVDAYRVTVHAGRLIHGTRDVTARLDGLRHKARTVSAVLGVPVTALVALDGPPLVDSHGRRVSELTLDGIHIIPADRLTEVLRAAARIPGQRPAADLAAAAERALPPYTRR